MRDLIGEFTTPGFSVDGLTGKICTGPRTASHKDPKGYVIKDGAYSAL